jgi:hypothetical protein
MDSVIVELEKLGIDAIAEAHRDALKLISGSGAYVVRGTFSPEATIDVFNNAIEQAYSDGFTGFRAAAEMSWALDCEDGAYKVILYEALLKALFESARATGLCLYNRTHMPVAVINGALATHPVAGLPGLYGVNPFYDPQTSGLVSIDEDVLESRLTQLAFSAKGPAS